MNAELEILHRCCICGEEYEGYGNDPWPFEIKGRCCDTCNTQIVARERMQLMQGNKL